MVSPTRERRAALTVVDVDGRQLKLSNLDKVLYPDVGFTKGQVIDYYTRIAPVLLPHLAGRPLTLKRYPNGVEAGYFYEKNVPPPSAVGPDAPVWSGHNKRTIDYCLVNDLPTPGVGGQPGVPRAAHRPAPGARRSSGPTMVVFDLDPGEPAGLVECAQVALWLREVLDDLGLTRW